MADRFPLIANPSTSQIQELSNLDNLDLSGNSIVGVTTIFATNVSIAGTLTYEDVTNVDSIGIITARSGVDFSNILKEGVKITADTLSNNPNVDLSNGMVHLFTTTETTTSTPNIRFDGSTSLNSKMSVGEAITVVTIVTAAASGYSAQLTIDGSAVTESWFNGSAPAKGGSSGYDVYNRHIIKTADATFIVLSNIINYA
tara:strand:- start:3345 stop:3944 length:600 start_codon:yes stop_codon:yes gene_type:complete